MQKYYSPSELCAIGISAAMVVMGIIVLPQSPDLIWAVLFFGVCGLLALLNPLILRWLPSRGPRVEHDQESVRTFFGEAVQAAIRWDEVDEIAVVTNDAGPSGEDVVWVFTNAGRSKQIAITGTSSGFPALLEELQGLPGFDHVTLIAAMGSVEAARFVVWRRPLA